MAGQPPPRYAVGRHWGTNLEPGTWYEIVHANNTWLIAGFVFVDARGTAECRDVDGSKLAGQGKDKERNAALRSGFLAAVGEEA